MAQEEESERIEAQAEPRLPGEGQGRARLRLVGGILAGLVLVGGGMAFLLSQVPGVPPSVQVVGGTRIELDTVPPEPARGPATLRLAIRDLNGRPRRGGKVWLNVGMDAMPSMGGAKNLEARETEPGIYTVAVAFQMAGTWDVRVRAEIPGETSQERHFIIAVR